MTTTPASSAAHIPPSAAEEHPTAITSSWLVTLQHWGMQHLYQGVLQSSITQWLTKPWGVLLLTVLTYGVTVLCYHTGFGVSVDWIRQVYLVGLVGALLWLYGLGYVVFQQKLQQVLQSVQTTDPSGKEGKDHASLALLKWMVGGGLLIALVAFLTPPFHSTDILGYVNRGWQQAAYGVNPYVVVVDAIPNWELDPVLTKHWEQNPCPYGPLFARLAQWVCLGVQGMGQLLGTAPSKYWAVMGFKALNLLAYLASAWILFRLAVQRLPQSSQEVTKNLLWFPMGLYLLLWNPLLMVHTFCNGHNDILMGFWLLAGLWCATQRRWWWAILPALTLGVLTKYIVVVAVPVALVWLWKQRAYRALGMGVLTSTVIALGVGLPYLEPGIAVAKVGQNASIMHSSISSVLFYLYKDGLKLFPQAWRQMLPMDRGEIKWAIKTGFVVLYGLGYAWMLGKITLGKWFSQKHSAEALSESAITDLRSTEIFQCVMLGVVIALICGFSAKFYPWYLMMFFPAVFLLRGDTDWGRSLRLLVVLLSVFLLAGITFLGQAHALNAMLMLMLPLVLWWQHHRSLGHLQIPGRAQNGLTSQDAFLVSNEGGSALTAEGH